MNALNSTIKKVLWVAALGAAGLTAKQASAQDWHGNRDWHDHDHDWHDRDWHDHDRGHVDLNIGDVFCPPVETVHTTRIWVEPVYRTVTDRVWVEPVYRTDVVRTWVEPVTECHQTVFWEHGHRIVRDEQVIVTPGHWEDRPTQCLVSEGHYQNVDRLDVVAPGHWEDQVTRVVDRPVWGLNLNFGR